jgi:hypothetical protein
VLRHDLPAGSLDLLLEALGSPAVLSRIAPT